MFAPSHYSFPTFAHTHTHTQNPPPRSTGFVLVTVTVTGFACLTVCDMCCVIDCVCIMLVAVAHSVYFVSPSVAMSVSVSVTVTMPVSECVQKSLGGFQVEAALDFFLKKLREEVRRVQRFIQSTGAELVAIYEILFEQCQSVSAYRFLFLPCPSLFLLRIGCRMKHFSLPLCGFTASGGTAGAQSPPS